MWTVLLVSPSNIQTDAHECADRNPGRFKQCRRADLLALYTTAIYIEVKFTCCIKAMRQPTLHCKPSEFLE